MLMQFAGLIVHEFGDRISTGLRACAELAPAHRSRKPSSSQADIFDFGCPAETSAGTSMLIGTERFVARNGTVTLIE